MRLGSAHWAAILAAVAVAMILACINFNVERPRNLTVAIPTGLSRPYHVDHPRTPKEVPSIARFRLLHDARLRQWAKVATGVLVSLQTDASVVMAAQQSAVVLDAEPLLTVIPLPLNLIPVVLSIFATGLVVRSLPSLKRQHAPSKAVTVCPVRESPPKARTGPLVTPFGDCTIRSWRPSDALPATYLVKRVQRVTEYAPNIEGDEGDCLEAIRAYGSENGEFLVVEREGSIVGTGAFTIGTQVTQFSSGRVDLQDNVAALRRICLDPDLAKADEFSDLLPFLVATLLNVARARGAREAIALGFTHGRAPNTQPTPAMLTALGIPSKGQFRAPGASWHRGRLDHLVAPWARDRDDAVDVMSGDGTVLGRYPRAYADRRRLLVRR